MPTMPDSLLLIAALLSSSCGMAWLALSMKPHWQQVRGNTEPADRTVYALRGLGALALIASLWLCTLSDHISMAVLVWFMALAASALSVAFTLTWRPRLLAWLVVWARA